MRPYAHPELDLTVSGAMVFKFHRAALAGALLAIAGYAPASAQSFDCAKPGTPTEKVICSSKPLSAKDKELAAVYARATAEAKGRAPEEASRLRDSQRKWIAARNRDCVDAGKDQAFAVTCLIKAYDARMAALRKPSSASPATASAEKADKPLQKAEAKEAAQRKPSSASPATAPAEKTDKPLQKEVAKEAAQPAPEPVPQMTRAAAAAKLQADEVPAVGEGQALLTVETPGRFSIRAQSKTGVALQLVDMLSGPSEKAGDPGTRDGRLDLLLDKGVYKIKTFGAEKASGTAKLSASAFHEAAAVFRLGNGFEGRLGDLEQRSFVLVVGKGGRVAVEAMGRSLQDLRLWRDGSELANLTPEFSAAEPKPGQPLTHARLEGTVEPGTYVVTAYGGEKLAWASGAKDEPFRIRPIETRSLAAGVAEGVIGPFGAERFALSSSANYLRLELPEVATAQLKGTRSGTALVARITKLSREPAAVLQLPAGGGEGFAEVIGLEGQAFRVLAVSSSHELQIAGSGSHLISVDVAGESADELPASAVLARFAGGKATAVASSAPRLGAGQAWRRKFNLRGTSSMIFEKTAAGPVAIRAVGVGVTATIEPLLAGPAPRSDGSKPSEYDLETGWYMLKIEPVDGAQGELDLTIGQPGLLPVPAAPGAARIAIPFGVHRIEKDASYRILTGSVPGIVTGPKAVALPADLGKEALAIFQPAQDKAAAPASANGAGEKKPSQPGTPAPEPGKPDADAKKPEPAPLEIPVRAPLGGTISVTGVNGAPIEAALSGEKKADSYRTLTIKVRPAKDSRTIIVSWKDAKPGESAAPSIAPQAVRPALAAGKPNYFDLSRGQERSFDLTVAQGGLYRVETLGRLKTSLRAATAFLPNLASAADNGAGHNALLQTYLRAGTYHVAVKASESAGHLGLAAIPAPLLETELLVPEGSVRASLSSGKGALVPFEIAEAGEYRLDLYGLGRELTARLEDADGWPLAQPGRMSTRTEHLAAGRYRLVVLPEAVDARFVARLRRVKPEVQPEGHGPHSLVFGQSQAHRWHEPQAKDAPRDPDRWEFSLEGEAAITLTISEGMAGDLIRQGEGGDEPVARIAGNSRFSGKLSAGRYRLEARSTGRNDGLDYEVALRAREIQPGVPKFVRVPEHIPFAIATDRVVSLTTFGRKAFSATLQDAGGRVLERLPNRTGDWNAAMSRLLPAGAYSLVLEETAGAKKVNFEEASEEVSEAEQSEEEAPEPSAGAVEVHLALPGFEAGEALILNKAVRFTANGVRQFPLPSTGAGRLTIAAAEADAEIVASLEREENGRWNAVAFERGRSPVLAWPADGKGGKLRLSVWAIDGGPAHIAVSATAIDAGPAEPGKVALKPAVLDGIGAKFRVALVHAPLAGLIDLAGFHEGLRAGSTPGRTLEPTSGGILIPQSESLWLLSSGEGGDTLSLEPYSAAGDIALALGDGEKATLPQAPVPSNKLRLWQAVSSLGQPGLDAGEGFGVAKDSALALAGAKTLFQGPPVLQVWNASGRESLRLSLAPIEVALLPQVAAEDDRAGALLPPFSALPVRLRGKEAQAEFNLAAGIAAVAKGSGGRKVTVWAGSEAVSRTIHGDFSEVLLINTTGKPAPAKLTLSPSESVAASLTPAKVYKRFFGAAGSLSLGIEVKAGDRLVAAGADATFIGAAGEVLRGRSIVLPGPGEVTLEHGAGLLAAWIESKGTSPWPSVRASSADLPSSQRLEGEAMSFKIAPRTPVLLHARTTSPIILSFSQGADEAPQLYPAGAVFDRYLAPGKAELRLYSPYDGPLGGSIELSASPVIAVSEGLGEPVAIASGETALFGFEVKKAGLVGTGIRSEPDRAEARLLDASGKVLGQGVNIITKLEPGRYFLEASLPASRGAGTVRPSVAGIAPPPQTPPAEVTDMYLEMAGMKQKSAR
jgi:uncharacterized protein